MGSILTCTDVLSFIIKLKRSGVPQKITAVIEGESLFNYCTCVLIFQFISVHNLLLSFREEPHRQYNSGVF
jgi:NhaP-type Na+/H+ or K+/H+ antiporter